MPRVSVIIPSFNHGKFLRQRIESVLQQSYQDYELLLLDDGSTDNSAAILADYADHSCVTAVVQNSKNGGSPFLQWSKGVSLAKGELIWIAESDDWAERTFLETMVPLMANADCTLAYCHSHRVVDAQILPPQDFPSIFGSQRWESDFTLAGHEALAQFLALYNAIPNASAVLFRRQAFLDSTRTPDKMIFAGDWLIWGQLAAQGQIRFCQQALNYFRFHPDCSRKRNPSSHREQSRYAEVLSTVRFLHALIGKIPDSRDPRLYWVVRGLFATPLGQRFFNSSHFHQVLNANAYVIFGTGQYVADLIDELGHAGWQKPVCIVDVEPKLSSIGGVPVLAIQALPLNDQGLPVVVGTNMYLEEVRRKIVKYHPLKGCSRIISLEEQLVKIFPDEIADLFAQDDWPVVAQDVILSPSPAGLAASFKEQLR